MGEIQGARLRAGAALERGLAGALRLQVAGAAAGRLAVARQLLLRLGQRLPQPPALQRCLAHTILLCWAKVSFSFPTSPYPRLQSNLPTIFRSVTSSAHVLRTQQYGY